MHRTVLLQETVACLAVRPGGVYIDATLGSGGHAAEILKQAGPKGRLLGIDCDPEALERAHTRLAAGPGQAVLVHGNHHDLGRLAEAHGFDEVDGMVLDLGVSSDQLDTPERGFSFQEDGPLDMRMDPTQGETAAELLARLDVAELADLLRRLGEEPQAGRLARMLVRERENVPIRTTGRLATLVTQAAGGRGGRRCHPATRTFQALRMAVNGELPALVQALDDALALLRPDGRLAVIAFESLTDRIVKQCFTGHVGAQESLQQGGSRWRGTHPAVAWVARHPLGASPEELADNPRARSAKLRAVRRLRPEEEPLPGDRELKPPDHRRLSWQKGTAGSARVRPCAMGESR